MPLVLDDDAAKWVLDELSLQQIAGFLKPCPDGWLPLAPASPLVNDVRNDGPELLDPAAPRPRFQLELTAPAVAARALAHVICLGKAYTSKRLLFRP